MLRKKIIIVLVGSFFSNVLLAQIPSTKISSTESTVIFNKSSNQIEVEYQTCDGNNFCKSYTTVNIGVGRQHNYVVIPTDDQYVSVSKVTSKDSEGNVIAQGSFNHYGEGSCAGYDINPIILDDMDGSPYIICNAVTYMGKNY